MTLCIVPGNTPGGTIRALRRWCADIGVNLVVNNRAGERRAEGDRRSPDHRPTSRRVERRHVHNSTGRRTGEQRETFVPVAAPAALPRRARSHADEIEFVEALEIAPEFLEDIESARVVVRIQAGETHLFERIYNQYFDRVYAYARALDPYAPEQALQEAFLDLRDSVSTYDPSEQSFRVWVCSAVSRRLHGHAIAMDRLRGNPREASGAPQSDERDVPEWVTDTDLQVLMSRLPVAQREVVLLRYLMALSPDQLAAVVEEPRETILELNAEAMRSLGGLVEGLSPQSEAPSMRLAMARRRRSGRVLQSRRMALMPG